MDVRQVTIDELVTSGHGALTLRALVPHRLAHMVLTRMERAVLGDIAQGTTPGQHPPGRPRSHTSTRLLPYVAPNN